MASDAPATPTNPHWPLFDLVVRTPTLVLRPPTDDVAVQLADLAVQGIHDPATMPFSIPWTDAEPAVVPRSSMQWWWRQRAELTSASWSVGFAVHRRIRSADADGGERLELAGVQDVMAKDFVLTRQVLTGSWLGAAHQGQGVGKEMRAAVLHLAFVGLGAQAATTEAWADNLASQGVTGSLPYRRNGEHVALRRGVADRMLDFRVDRADWESVRRDDIVIEGLEPCLGMLGLEDDGATG